MDANTLGMRRDEIHEARKQAFLGQCVCYSMSVRNAAQYTVTLF